MREIGRESCILLFQGEVKEVGGTAEIGDPRSNAGGVGGAGIPESGETTSKIQVPSRNWFCQPKITHLEPQATDGA